MGDRLLLQLFAELRRNPITEQFFQGPDVIGNASFHIELAIAKGILYILQSRPITTLSGYKPDTAEWNDSMTGNFLWSGTNLAEAAPFVLTPFSCSLRKGMEMDGLDLCESSSMGISGYPLAGVIGGRGYINLSVQVSAIRPFIGGDTRRAAQQITAIWGGIPQNIDIPLVPISRRTWWLQVMPSMATGMAMAVAKVMLNVTA